MQLAFSLACPLDKTYPVSRNAPVYKSCDRRRIYSPKGALDIARSQSIRGKPIAQGIRIKTVLVAGGLWSHYLAIRVG